MTSSGISYINFLVRDNTPNSLIRKYHWLIYTCTLIGANQVFRQRWWNARSLPYFATYNLILPQGSDVRSVFPDGHVISSGHAGWCGSGWIDLPCPHPRTTSNWPPTRTTLCNKDFNFVIRILYLVIRVLTWKLGFLHCISGFYIVIRAVYL